MTNPINGQRISGANQPQPISESVEIETQATRIDDFIRENYPEVHRSDTINTIDDAMDRLRKRELSPGTEGRENENIITPNDPRFFGL